MAYNYSMRFTDYVQRWRQARGPKTSRAAYARAIGVDSSTVSRLMRVGQVPGVAIMLRIYEESGGLVGPMDWYPEIEKARRRFENQAAVSAHLEQRERKAG